MHSYAAKETRGIKGEETAQVKSGRAGDAKWRHRHSWVTPRKMGTFTAKEEKPHNTVTPEQKPQCRRTRLPPASATGASVTSGERLAQCSGELEA